MVRACSDSFVEAFWTVVSPEFSENDCEYTALSNVLRSFWIISNISPIFCSWENEVVDDKNKKETKLKKINLIKNFIKTFVIIIMAKRRPWPSSQGLSMI